MQLIKASLSVTAVCFAALLGSCGGGGGAPAPPAPTINPVEEISEADLTAAGVPALPADNGTSRAGSLTSNLDLWGFVNNSGVLSLGPNLPSQRIVGWALFRIQPESTDQIYPLAVQFETSGSQQYRVFYAVGNYSTGKWEIGNRIVIDVIGAGFSLGNRYTSPQGNLYVLVVVANPGSSNPPTSALTASAPQVQWTGPSITGQEWTGELSRQGPDDFTLGIKQDTTICTSFALDWSASMCRLFFPAVFEPTNFKGTDEELQALWSTGVPESSELGFLSPLPLPSLAAGPVIGFYHTNELHGIQRPFTLHTTYFGDANLDGYMSSFEVGLTATSAVVTGMYHDHGSEAQVEAGVHVSVLNQAEEVLFQTTTDDQGVFSFDLLNLFGGGSASSSVNRAPSIPSGPVDFILRFTTGQDDRMDAACTASFRQSSEGGISGVARIDCFENQAGWYGH